MSADSSIRARVHRIVHVGDTALGRAFDAAVLVLIVSSVVAFIAESYEDVAKQYAEFFRGFEAFVVAAFTLEYALRFWTCTYRAQDNGLSSSRSRWAFAVSPMSIIDLLAILPFYVQVGDLRVVRVLRVFRLFRLLKLARYSDALQTIGGVLRDLSHQLVVFLFIVMTALLLAASAMYYAEHDLQPQQFRSIPHTFWWAIVTLTTVGYGDAVPVTLAGKVLAGIVMVMGVGVIALPTGLIGSALVERLGRKERKKCPHCGRDV